MMLQTLKIMPYVFLQSQFPKVLDFFCYYAVFATLKCFISNIRQWMWKGSNYVVSSQRGLQLIFQQHALKLWQERQAQSNTLQHAHQLLTSTINHKIFHTSIVLNVMTVWVLFIYLHVSVWDSTVDGSKVELNTAVKTHCGLCAVANIFVRFFGVIHKKTAITVQ